jgi:hypothetical protein
MQGCSATACGTIENVGIDTVTLGAKDQGFEDQGFEDQPQWRQTLAIDSFVGIE